MKHNRTILKDAKITKKKKRSWNIREKLVIVTYLERNPAASKQNTAEQFDISPKQLRKWIKKKKELKNAPPYVRHLNIGACPTYPLLESDLMSWIKSLRSKQKAVTLHMIRTKAKQLAKQSHFISVYPRINKCKWNQVDPAYIRRSFKCCGISIAQDRSEQDMMFDYEWTKNPELDKELVKEIRRLMFWVKGLKVDVDTRGSLLGAEEK
ncbi:4294_t:CDS:2 [Cetraspora pellucida]|uniref:4294_t:CDS:1 n=1 Tax=Cetraspora pellucida TaxID=1433469 RepID=A0A9N9AKT0_9GLOM|nr:4294_t:CDS:2 [Cetraspora pellucida]